MNSFEFTLNIYQEFLQSIKGTDYVFQSLGEFMSSPEEKAIILRHDVDRKPINALKTAQIENSYGIKASYYFRIVPESYDKEIIKKIVSLGHEIGYHYEDLSLCKGDFEKAIKIFERNLKELRRFYPIKTICMHGSPLSKWDNRDLWKKYNYKEYGIIAEPYFDLDFNKIFYITDAGRSWNNRKASIRDKVETEFDIPINSIKDLYHLFNLKNAPRHIMLNIHPNNWAKNSLEWSKIVIWQSMKNIIKRLIVLYKNK